jgi:hypothetical protein
VLGQEVNIYLDYVLGHVYRYGVSNKKPRSRL